MGTERQSIGLLENESNVHKKLGSPKMQTFFLGFQEKVQECLKSNFKRLTRNRDSTISSIIGGNSREAAIIDLDKEKQLQSWKENPSWADHPPVIKVSVPKGSLCNLNVSVNVGLPPDAVYDIVIDPENKRVFKNIKEVISRKVLVDDGLRQVVELEQAAMWRFLWWSGTIPVHVLVDQNRENHTMKFKQVKTGFMQRFEGCWRVEPLLVDEDLCHPFKPKTLADYISYTKGKGRIGSKVSLDQLIQPAIVPPPPISWYLRGITSKTTEMIVTDLLAETARIRGSSGNEDSKCLKVPQVKETSVESQLADTRDIKERWALRRKAKRNPRRLVWREKSC